MESEKLLSNPIEGGDCEFEGPREIIKVPSVPVLDFGNAEPKTLTYNVPKLEYEDIYDNCIQYVQEHCCYGSKFVKEMELPEIKNGGAFHYLLESFCEKRESTTLITPYSGQHIDGPENGSPPAPWDIVAEPPAMFQNGQQRYEIPHTAQVAPCDKCDAVGRVACELCQGKGRRKCGFCFGQRRRFGKRCSYCMGTGRRRCWDCEGNGQVMCKRCHSHGSVKICVMLIVTWTNHTGEFVSNAHNLPENLVKEVTGFEMFSEEKERVMPIVNAPDGMVNAASLRLIENHQRCFPNELILKQRHALRMVPLTKVLYEWRNKQGEFYVYGVEKEVYFQKYPQKYCSCTCL